MSTSSCGTSGSNSVSRSSSSISGSSSSTKPEPHSDKLCLGNYNHCIMIIIIIITIIVTHLFSFSVDASTSPCLHKNLMKCTSMRKLVLARTVQHRATRQASIDTDCAAPWKMTHSWRHVARRAACGGLHLSVHKKLMNCTSMRQLVLTRTVQHRATRQASIDTDCAAPWNVTATY